MFDCSGEYKNIVKSIPRVLLCLVCIKELPKDVHSNISNGRSDRKTLNVSTDKESQFVAKLLLKILFEVGDACKINILVTIVNDLTDRDTSKLNKRWHPSIKIQNELVCPMFPESSVFL